MSPSPSLLVTVRESNGVQNSRLSDVVISGVPSANYQIKTDNLKEGVVAINFSESKNFESNVKDKVRSPPPPLPFPLRFPLIGVELRGK